MAQQTEVVVEVNYKGDIHVDVNKHQGPSCKKILQAFDGLGKLVSEGEKPEYYRPEVNRNLNISNVRNG